MARSLHRTGRRYLDAKAEMHARYGYLCHICGHYGAGEADHLTPVSVDPGQPIDPELMRPSHGSNYPCRLCRGEGGKGRACNQERGIRPVSAMFTPTLTW